MTDPALGELVALALREDLGPTASLEGDVTSLATVPEGALAQARAVARSSGVIAGLEAAGAVFAQVDPSARWEPRRADGQRVAPGDVVAEVSGSARALLAAERTALNLLGRLSGVATATARYVDALEGTGCAVRDTRKTTPGMRALEKAAVRVAGGANHRFGLFDALLVKDNHVAAAGGVAPAVRQAVAFARSRGLPVQVEVDDLDGLEAALAEGVDAVLLDNFGLDDLAEAVRRCRKASGPVFVEASGGITLRNVRAVAERGVDAVAVGALTHSAPALDVALDFDSA